MLNLSFRSLLCLSSEVVGRPLAALLANDGARVISIDIDCELYSFLYFQLPSILSLPIDIAIVEFSKRPSTSTTSKFNPHHIVSPLSEDFNLQRALAISDIVISAVPSDAYKIPTKDLKDGCICVNVAGEKNFEKSVRERASPLLFLKVAPVLKGLLKASIYMPSVGIMTIAMLQRNLWVYRCIESS